MNQAGSDAKMPHEAPASHRPATEVLDELLRGNERFVGSENVNCADARARRAAVAEGQTPHAIVLGCSDSRIPPETVFDQRLGDVFVVRIAGNVPDDFGLASIEYAVAHFGSPLLIVLGHDACGAVQATLDVATGRAAMPPGHLGKLVQALGPAVQSVLSHDGNQLANAVVANIRAVARSLTGRSPVLQKSVAARKLKIVGARYSLSSGVVSIVS